MKWQDPSESMGYCFNLLCIAVQGFRTQMNRKNILHSNSLQYFLTVDYYARYTERVKPSADENVLEVFPKINKTVGWLKLKSHCLPSISKEVEMSRLFCGSTLCVFGLALHPKVSLNAWNAHSALDY